MAATIDAIAAHAGVSPETIYATFRTTLAAVAAARVAIAGDDVPVPILARPWVQQLREETDAQRRLRLLAANERLILERSAPIYEVLWGAAAADAEIASLWEQAKTQRLAGQRALLGILTERAPLRHDLPATTAADIFSAIRSPRPIGSWSSTGAGPRTSSNAGTPTPWH